VEAKFQALPSPDNQREFMRRLTARPHHVGSPYDKGKTLSGFSRNSRNGVGTPRLRRSTFFSPPQRSACSKWSSPRASPQNCRSHNCPLTQPPSSRASNSPAITRTSVDGDVTAPLIFVNYGPAERLRATRSAGNLCQGSNRHRKVRPFMARHQAKSGCRTRCHRPASYTPIQATTAIS